MRRTTFLFFCLVLLTALSCNSQDKKNASETTETDKTQTEESAKTNSEKSVGTTAPKDVSERLVYYLRSKFGTRLPAQAEITVGDFESTSANGIEKSNFFIEIPGRGKQGIPFLISSDKKYIIIGSEGPIDLTKFENSPIPGFKKGDITFGRQPLPVLVSEDGKSIIVGELLDSTVDPLKDIKDKISLNDVPVKGNENAEVVVVEYSDFQCPFCKRASEMLPQILNEYEGRVKVIYKQFPLSNHKWAKGASIASVCSYNQGNDKFWEFHDKLFQKQKEVSLENSKEKFVEVATDVGLDTSKFKKCLGSKEVAQRVEQDISEAGSIGVTSTPTFVINGMIVPGANLQGIKNAIEFSLSNNKS